MIIPPTPIKKDVKLPEVAEEKPTDADAEVKPKAEDAVTGDSAAKQEGDSAMQENGDEKPKVESADEVKPEDAKETAGTAKEEDVTPAPVATNADNVEEPVKKLDDDSILVPGSATTLLIKTLPPDLTRGDLEAHCKQVEGFDYIALAEPNPTKKFYRIGWVVFKPDADMTSAVEKLCESKVRDCLETCTFC